MVASVVDWLETNYSVHPNPSIPSAITFQLINNTCNTNTNVNNSTNNVLSVRRVYSTSAANRDTAVGWGVVLGDPVEMYKMTRTDQGTLKPCTALLQATDGVTGENLTVAKINASIQDCFESSSASVNPKALSCNGHGAYNDDPDRYNGVFLGCTCFNDYAGDRCDDENQKYIVSERACKGFEAAFLPARREGLLPNEDDYINPDTDHDFTVGSTIRIRAFKLNGGHTNVSSGTPGNITYKLAEGAPPMTGAS